MQAGLPGRSRPPGGACPAVLWAAWGAACRLRPEPPELLIPFQQSPADLRPVFEKFIKPVWLRPDDFNSRSLLQRLTPSTGHVVVDSDLSGDWKAEMATITR